MKIKDYLLVDTINLNLKSRDKDKVLKELYEGISDSANIKNKEKCFKDLLEREKLGSTGVGNMVAIPHAKSSHVDKLIMTIGVSDNEIEYESIDSNPVRIFFMFLSPQNLAQEYLILLAKISRYIKEEKFRNELLNAKTSDDVLRILDSKEN